MFPYKALLSLILIGGTAVDATPLSHSSGKASLSVAMKINERGTLNIAEQSRARTQALGNASHLEKRGSTTFDIMNDVTMYIADIGVGSPATDYTLLIDTASSNTWIGASHSKQYTKTSTSRDTGNRVSVRYGKGQFVGEQWIDTVVLSAGLVVKSQSIGVAHSSNGFNGVDGILGLGPVGLTSKTVHNTQTVPTVMDNLVAQKTVSLNMLGVYFIPASASNDLGTLTFGGYDEAAITSMVRYAPLTTTSPASHFWGIDLSIAYGGNTILSTAAGIVDCGNSLIFIASDAFEVYKFATGGVHSTTGLLRITHFQYSALQTLSFTVGDHAYNLSPNAQIWPRFLNSFIGGSSGSIYLIVADSGASTGRGLEFVLGYPFIERYYIIFDADQKRMGFAATAYTNTTTN